jgi:hypothetical protein
MFLAGSVDVFVADESTFSSFAIQGTFSDLSELIDPSALSSLDAELYRCENADGDEIIAGIVLHQGSPLHEAGYYQGDVVIGIAATSKNTDSAIAFLKSLL